MRLNDALMERVRREAARRGTTLTALIEEGLERVLAGEPQDPPSRVLLPVCTRGGGTLPGIDLTDTSALLDLMENL